MCGAVTYHPPAWAMDQAWTVSSRSSEPSAGCFGAACPACPPRPSASHRAPPSRSSQWGAPSQKDCQCHTNDSGWRHRRVGSNWRGTASHEAASKPSDDRPFGALLCSRSEQTGRHNVRRHSAPGACCLAPVCAVASTAIDRAVLTTTAGGGGGGGGGGGRRG